MKFGKMFKKQIVPEWIDAFMDYRGLKRILGEITRYKQSQQASKPMHLHRTFSGLHLNPNAPLNTGGDTDDEVIDVNVLQKNDDARQYYMTNFLKQSEEGGDIEAAFFRKLDEELNKVNTFYRDKVDEMIQEAAVLNKQMDTLVALRIKVQKAQVDGSNSKKHPGFQNIESILDSFGEEGVDILPQTNPVCQTEFQAKRKDTDSRSDTIQVLERVKINNTLETPMSTLKGVFRDSKDKELSYKKEELKKVEERLRLAFIEFYQKLRILKQYSFMNLSAFSKIMKKYEKTTSRRASRIYMKTVDNSFLGSSDEVNGLLERVEASFVKHFSNSNRREGMKSLRPKAKREKHSVTFFSGFFSGCAIALLAAIILKIETTDLMGKKEGTIFLVNMFPLYSLFVYIILHMLMYAANLYFWRRYRVNYPFIFGFKEGTELGYREVFLLGTGFAVLTLASFLANLQLNTASGPGHYTTITELVPLGLVTIVLATILCPFDIIYSSSRFFFIRSLFRCVCAPLYQVTLPDFFLADHLTSQIQAIRSLELYICYYALGGRSQRQNKCHMNGVYNAFYFVVAVIPYWLRLLQCMRRLCEERDAMHAYNGLKYLLTIVAVLVRTAFELKKGMTWKVLALCSSAVATAMSTFWDIVIDWGLLRRRSKNTFLRDKLLVPHKSVYFAAMVLNVVMRLAWMQLVLEFNFSVHKIAITTMISCVEIIRRGMWSFFRLENEHLNNVGKYRAFKSVPLPFNYYDEVAEKDD